MVIVIRMNWISKFYMKDCWNTNTTSEFSSITLLYSSITNDSDLQFCLFFFIFCLSISYPYMEKTRLTWALNLAGLFVGSSFRRVAPWWASASIVGRLTKFPHLGNGKIFFGDGHDVDFIYECIVGYILDEHFMKIIFHEVSKAISDNFHIFRHTKPVVPSFYEFILQ